MKANVNAVVTPSMPTKKSSRKAYLVRRIIFTNLLSIAVIICTYLWMVFFLSSVSSFWDLFRGKEVSVNQDTIPPTAPFLNDVPEATQSSTLNVQGLAEPGVKVELYVDGSKISDSISDSNGVFLFDNIPVGVFKQEIYAKAVDEAGNISNESNHYSIQQDTTAPEVEITSPDKKELSHRATEHAYRIVGKSEPGVTVTVNEQLAVVNPNGEFFANLRLEEGGNNIKIIVKDKALNETVSEVYINFSKID